MPTTFPIDIIPSAINDRTAPEHAVSRFKSESGFDTRICSGCSGHSISFTLVFDPLTPLQEGKLLKFWQSIGGSSNGSCKSFLLPDCWRGWDLVKSWPVWQEQLAYDSLDRHWWIVTNRLTFNGSLCFLQGASLTIENVYRRA